MLLPRPDVQVQAALKLDPERRLRVAELEAQLVADPGEPQASLELADHFLDGHRPDWALAVLTKATERAPQDYRLYARRALALAEHFEATDAFTAVQRALALCRAAPAPSGGEAAKPGQPTSPSPTAPVKRAGEPGEAGAQASSVPCGETERSRLELLHATLERVNGLDMRRDPDAARARIMQALRPTYIPPQRKSPAKPSAPAPPETKKTAD